MDTQRAMDEAEIRQRIDKLEAAIRVMDLNSVMSIYAPDIVSFDLEPPLQHVGAEATRKNWSNAFSMYQRPLGYEIRDLTITVGDDRGVWARPHSGQRHHDEREQDRRLAALHNMLSKNQRHLAHRSRPGVGTS